MGSVVCPCHGWATKLICFIEPIVRDNEPGVLNREQRIHAHHLNYVAGSTGPHLPHLQTDPATNTVDNQGQALAAPCLGRSLFYRSFIALSLGISSHSEDQRENAAMCMPLLLRSDASSTCRRADRGPVALFCSVRRFLVLFYLCSSCFKLADTTTM